jgi:ribokinase
VAAAGLLTAGPSLMAIALTGSNLSVWRGGHLDIPVSDDDDVVDTTGGGDAFVAALTSTLLHGHDHRTAACHAVAASGPAPESPSGRAPQNRRKALDG